MYFNLLQPGKTKEVQLDHFSCFKKLKKYEDSVLSKKNSQNIDLIFKIEKDTKAKRYELNFC